MAVWIRNDGGNVPLGGLNCGPKACRRQIWRGLSGALVRRALRCFAAYDNGNLKRASQAALLPITTFCDGFLQRCFTPCILLWLLKRCFTVLHAAALARHAAHRSSLLAAPLHKCALCVGAASAMFNPALCADLRHTATTALRRRSARTLGRPRVTYAAFPTRPNVLARSSVLRRSRHSARSDACLLSGL